MTQRTWYITTSLFTAVLASVLWLGCSESVTDFEETEVSDALIAELSARLLKTTGNGAPNGAHYQLNLIGVPKNKTAAMDDNNGHRIFVKLEGNTKIYLTEGEFFDVIDANGTDGNGAKFQLPNPDPDNDGVTVYSVYARPLGRWGGSGSITPCATAAGEDGVFGTDDDEEVCSMTVLTVERTKGNRSTFQNVSKYLLYVYADLDGDSVVERYNLFSDELQDYLWSYDNQGLKLIQLRFYEESTDVTI